MGISGSADRQCDADRKTKGAGERQPAAKAFDGGSELAIGTGQGTRQIRRNGVSGHNQAATLGAYDAGYLK